MVPDECKCIIFRYHIFRWKLLCTLWAQVVFISVPKEDYVYHQLPFRYTLLLIFSQSISPASHSFFGSSTDHSPPSR